MTQSDSDTDSDRPAFRNTLEQLTLSYNQGEQVPVRFAGGAFAHPNEWVSVPKDPSSYGVSIENGPQELRFIADTLAHEIQHIRSTDLTGKRDAMKEYPMAPHIAGMVWNICEDRYIDDRRLTRFPGQRRSLAWKIHLLAYESENPKFGSIAEMPKHKSMLNGLLQISNMNTAFGLNDADEDVQEFLAWSRAKLRQVSNEDNQTARTELYREITDMLLSYLPDVNQADAWANANSFENADLEEDDDVERREMTEEEKERFEQMRKQMPQMSQSGGSDGEDGEDGEDGGEEEGASSSGSQSGQSGSQSQQGGSTQQNTPPRCPNCGYEKTKPTQLVVDGMVAARANVPFDLNAPWVTSVEFISNNEVCGFRVNPSGTVPKQQIESMGYKVVSVSSGVEILEPVSKYGDTETLRGFECPDCSHEWVPTLGGDL